ncbi:hypothetical protein QSV34_03480 [Porticoccus sp. W117]|uniref:hypothetical protein n=1 Tax=Porticoccus sp. W117 TaxID=3054777 RepID=UPI0025965A83|nr:hypothetical protein [Porticoccus sp. W117]MDM3870412.1 hypothetical protein [Porticoccus sp. W117]
MRKYVLVFLGVVISTDILAWRQVGVLKAEVGIIWKHASDSYTNSHATDHAIINATSGVMLSEISSGSFFGH